MTASLARSAVASSEYGAERLDIRRATASDCFPVSKPVSRRALNAQTFAQLALGLKPVAFRRSEMPELLAFLRDEVGPKSDVVARVRRFGRSGARFFRAFCSR